MAEKDVQCVQSMGFNLDWLPKTESIGWIMERGGAGHDALGA